MQAPLVHPLRHNLHNYRTISLSTKLSNLHPLRIKDLNKCSNNITSISTIPFRINKSLQPLHRQFNPNSNINAT